MMPDARCALLGARRPNACRLTRAAPDARRILQIVGEEIIIADVANHRLSIFEHRSGTFLRTLGCEGDGPGQFRNPRALTTFSPPDRDGPMGRGASVLAVCEKQRVQLVTLLGEPLETIAVPTAIDLWSICNSGGHLFLTDRGGHMLHHLQPSAAAAVAQAAAAARAAAAASPAKPLGPASPMNAHVGAPSLATKLGLSPRGRAPASPHAPPSPHGSSSSAALSPMNSGPLSGVDPFPSHPKPSKGAPSTAARAPLAGRIGADANASLSVQPLSATAILPSAAATAAPPRRRQRCRSREQPEPTPTGHAPRSRATRRRSAGRGRHRAAGGRAAVCVSGCGGGRGLGRCAREDVLLARREGPYCKLCSVSEMGGRECNSRRSRSDLEETL